MRITDLIALVLSVAVINGCASSMEFRYDPATESPLVDTQKPADLRQLPLNAGWFTPIGEDPAIDQTREYATESFIYAVAADEVYDRSLSEFEPIPFPRSETWTSANKDGADPETGFFARSWIRTDRTGKRELVIAFRGTNDGMTFFGKDWRNANWVFWPGTHQYSHARNYAEETVNKVQEAGVSLNDIVVTGHSLGGGLAQYVQRFIPGSRAVVIASSPNTGWILSGFHWNAVNEERWLRVFERGEILQYARWLGSPDFGDNADPLATGKKTRWFDTYDGKLISGVNAQHRSQDTAMSIVRVAATTGKCEALDIISQLEAKRSEHMCHPYYHLDCPDCPRKQLRNISRATSITDVCKTELGAAL